MAKPTRSDDWGFPRWRPYGAKGREAVRIRLCDGMAATNPATVPRPGPQQARPLDVLSRAHAAEYIGLELFRRLSPEEAAGRAAEEEGANSAFRTAAQYQWAGSGDGSRSRDEMRALDALELEVDADFAAIKAGYRRLAKQFHPDVNQGDAAAATRFQQIQASYEGLRSAEERKAGVKL